MIRKIPIIIPTSAGKIINTIPNMIAIIAKTGLETVMPILRKPFSTASVKKWFLQQQLFCTGYFKIGEKRLLGKQ
jgi:hypothetical protein